MRFLSPTIYRFFFFYLFTLTTVLAQTQQYCVLTEQISTKEGLSNRFVRSIWQDTKGFMWIGTKIGLNRYDGENFKIFNNKNSALQSSYIEEIWEDADSNLWLGHGLNNELSNSFENIDVVNINTFEIQTLQEYLGADVPIKANELYSIFNKQGSKDLYLTTKRGRIYLYKGRGNFELFYDSKEPAFIHDIRFGEGRTWVCSSNKLLVINQDKQVVDEYPFHIPVGLRGDLFTQLDSTTLLLTIHDGYNTSSVWEWRVQEHQLLRQNSHLTLLDELQPIHIGTQLEHYPENGFSFLYSRIGCKIYDENRKLIYEDNYLKVKKILRVAFVDRQGNIWLGVSTKGLVKISIVKNRFDTYLKGISTRAITTTQSKDKLVIGSYGGRFFVDTKTSEEQMLDNIATDNAITYSKFGDYYWSTYTATLYKRNTEDLEEIRRYTYKQKDYTEKFKETAIDLQSTWCLHEDTKGRVWLGTDNGLGYLDPNADSLRFFIVPTPYENLNHSVIYDIYENEQGLWVASSTGLYLKKATEQTWICYNKQQEKPYQLPFDYLFDLNEDSKGNLWLATQGGGVLRLNPKTGACRQWTTRQGLSHDVIYATLEDDYGNIWMSSNKGLMRMDTTTYLINTYLIKDGLPHEEFNRESAYKHPNGQLYFGGLGGVIGFDGSDFLDTSSNIPPLYVTRYQYYNGKESSLIDATALLEQKQVIDLKYDDRFFILELALLDFRANAHKTYAYKIEGVQEDWVFTKEPTIRVDGLRPGTYKLSVKAELSSDSWSPILLELPIVVRQPFYLQTPFIVALVILLLVTIFVYTRIREQRLYKNQLLLEQRVKERTKTIEEQALALKELDEMKTRFFANISHELRTPLTLILAPVEAALNNKQQHNPNKVTSLLQMVQKHGLKLKQLVEQILSLSKLEANQLALDERVQSLALVLKNLWANFEVQAELEGIEWSLEQDISSTLQVWIDVDKLEKIINNLLTNALKHTSRGGTILMRTHWEEATSSLLLEIKDSGKGIASEDLPHIFERFYQSKQGKAAGGTGIGLALVFELVQLMGGDIKVSSTVGKGSIFRLTFPLKSIVEDEWQETEVEQVYVLPEPVASDSETILIVDDLLDIRLFLSELLSPYYHVKTAENGQDALQVLTCPNHGVDLVVSDIMMPIMDGFELLEQLKQMPQSEQIPIIMLTARTDERDKLKALRIGVDDYLQKPFSNRELLARIKNLLKHYQQRQDWIKEQQATHKDVPKMAGEGQEQEVLLETITDPWVEDLEQIAKREVGNTQFNVAQLAFELNISERQLRRKIKAKTGLTPNQYFRCIKMATARDFLEQKRYETVSEVAYKVGFSNVHYFSKLYHTQYGKKPIEYLR